MSPFLSIHALQYKCKLGGTQIPSFTKFDTLRICDLDMYYPDDMFSEFLTLQRIIGDCSVVRLVHLQLITIAKCAYECIARAMPQTMDTLRVLESQGMHVRVVDDVGASWPSRQGNEPKGTSGLLTKILQLQSERTGSKCSTMCIVLSSSTYTTDKITSSPSYPSLVLLRACREQRQRWRR